MIARFLAFLIIFVALDEHHHIGVLFDRARFAQVGKLGAFVFAAFDLTGKLGQRDDGDVQLFGNDLQALGDFRDFLHPVVAL